MQTIEELLEKVDLYQIETMFNDMDLLQLNSYKNQILELNPKDLETKYNKELVEEFENIIFSYNKYYMTYDFKLDFNTETITIINDKTTVFSLSMIGSNVEYRIHHVSSTTADKRPIELYTKMPEIISSDKYQTFKQKFINWKQRINNAKSLTNYIYTIVNQKLNEIQRNSVSDEDIDTELKRILRDGNNYFNFARVGSYPNGDFEITIRHSDGEKIEVDFAFYRDIGYKALIAQKITIQQLRNLISQELFIKSHFDKILETKTITLLDKNRFGIGEFQVSFYGQRVTLTKDEVEFKIPLNELILFIYDNPMLICTK